MKSAGRLALVGLICVVSSQAFGQAASARGKSVIATWTEEREQRVGGMGNFVSRSFPHELRAYISDQGRVFAKRTVFSAYGRKGGGGGGRSGDVSSVGEDGGGKRKQMGEIQGRTLIVTNQLHGGARLTRIEFGPDFSTCTANVILGRENGSGVARARSLINGMSVEIKSAHVTNTSCRVQNGNVFGE